MAREWTPEQRCAIDTRNKSLLVSAAAGSGKTATLTQRIIESILDEENPTDISKMLIVTFTRAAVGELRERIAKAIKERLLEKPSDTRLEKQLMLLPGAKILTIDAFCNDCLKSFPDEAGINPGYRIADEAEVLLISKEVFDGITESVLRGELEGKVSAEEFDTLSDCLIDSKKMADVFDVFYRAYGKLRTTKLGIDTLRRMTDEYDPERFTSPEDTVFGKYILDVEREEFNLRGKLFSEYASALLNDENSVGNYAALAENESYALTRVAKTEGYEQMRAAIEGIQFERFSTPRGAEKTPLMTAFAEMRSKEKERIAKEKSKFFSYSSEEWKSAFEKIHPLARTFFEIMKIFDSALSEKKQQLGLFDYTDIERYALSALEKDGEPTELARSLREEYDYVYIDEYQDVNDLQDSIFRAVSKPENRFIVGDIKQSIYGFRSANPTIFADAKRSYPKIGEVKDTDPSASIFMSKNFRSSLGIIDFVNSVFDSMFSAFAESIDYDPEDRLTAARAPMGDSYYTSPTICVISEKRDGKDEETEETEDTGDDIAPAVVAKKIEELLESGCREDGSQLRPSDIAVILRSLKGKAEKYTAAIEALGIPVKTSGRKNFFMNSDVLLALCLLNAINNPLRDVYLTGLLRSPIFDFSPAELVEIRGKEKFKPFYKSLCSYVSEHPNFNKGASFIKTLSRWRERAENTRTDRLLSEIFRETGLLSLASEHGEKDNLIRLFEYARSFDGTGFGGLGAFISYINSVIAERVKFDCNIGTSEEDAVTVISAHSSKGLEFPVVFLADAGKKIDCPDVKERLLISTDFGLGIRHRTPLGLAVVDNPMINAVAERMTELSFEEELRILYVALTRAKEQLYVIGSVGEEDVKKYVSDLRQGAFGFKNRAAAKRLRSYLDIVAATSPADCKSEEEFLNISLKKEDEKLACESEKLSTGSDIDAECAAEGSNDEQGLEEIFIERFLYEYHSEILSELPEKLSVSSLSPSVLDGTDKDSLSVFDDAAFDKDAHLVPEFIYPSKSEESKRKGIATHLFLQFCDLEGLYKNGAKAELENLIKKGFLSKENAERVRLFEIEAFTGSELFERMRSARKLYREFRFNTPLPASLFTESSERQAALSDKKVLVQGVIDCIIEEKDGTLTVVDYKTDRMNEKELKNKELAYEKLRTAHERQLYYYALAIERIFGKRPERSEIYSLHLAEAVDVTKR